MRGGAQFAVDITLVCIACTRHPKQRVEERDKNWVGPSSRMHSVVLAMGVRDALFKPSAVGETPCTSWSRRSVDEMRKCGGCVELACWDVLQQLPSSLFDFILTQRWEDPSHIGRPLAHGRGSEAGVVYVFFLEVSDSSIPNFQHD